MEARYPTPSPVLVPSPETTRHSYPFTAVRAMRSYLRTALPLPRIKILNQLQFSPYETSVSYLLNTTDDNVVETPDESLTVSIYVPGMFPSFLGDLIAVVEIEVSAAS